MRFVLLRLLFLFSFCFVPFFSFGMKSLDSEDPFDGIRSSELSCAFADCYERQSVEGLDRKVFSSEAIEEIKNTLPGITEFFKKFFLSPEKCESFEQRFEPVFGKRYTSVLEAKNIVRSQIDSELYLFSEKKKSSRSDKSEVRKIALQAVSQANGFLSEGKKKCSGLSLQYLETFCPERLKKKKRPIESRKIKEIDDSGNPPGVSDCSKKKAVPKKQGMMGVQGALGSAAQKIPAENSSNSLSFIDQVRSFIKSLDCSTDPSAEDDK